LNLNLLNKIAVIAGGTKGIGLAIANAFLEEGASVHVIARNFPNEKANENLHFYQGDLTKAEDVAEISKKIFSKTGSKIDILICSVGNGKGTPEDLPDPLEWSRLWELNFETSVNCVRVFSESLKNNKGNIVFISSIAGLEYLGAPTAYAVAKSALIALSKNLSVKMAPEVRVNIIAPGNIFVEDGTWDFKLKSDPEGVLKMLEEKVALKRLGSPDEIANLAVFLASSKAAFITGACFVADGGQTVSY